MRRDTYLSLDAKLQELEAKLLHLQSRLVHTQAIATQCSAGVADIRRELEREMRAERQEVP